MNLKKEFPYLGFLAGVVVFFFWPVLFGGQGYYYGDYKQQFYPWASYLAQHLKSFSLPLWAPEIGCGFSLLAEGQSAMLYPLNWILFFPLPFHLAYRLGFIVLYLLAGFFSYIFFRKNEISPLGSAFASGVFLFGSAYAGHFYGLMALRVLIWFPLSLYYIEKLFRMPRSRTAVFLAGAWSMGFLGGYPQMAVYAVFAGLVYALARSFVFPIEKKINFLLSLSLAGLLAVGLAAVQIWPTLELASQSGRIDAGIDFALQKSLIPINLVTLLWPSFGAFMGFDFYLGIAPILLAASSLALWKENPRVRVFVGLTLFFIILAIGRFGGLYPLLIKITHFSSFRVPSKFIYFSCFFLSALAGIGLDHLVSASSKAIQNFRTVFWSVLAAAILTFACALAAVHFGRPFLTEWGHHFVINTIFGKTGHPHNLEFYFLKVDSLLEFAGQKISFRDSYFWKMSIIWGSFVAVALSLRFNFFRKRVFLASFFILITFLDLNFYRFISTGFEGNRRPSSEISGDTTTDFLKAQKGFFRTYEVSMVEGGEFKAPHLLPNSNMLFGYSTVGIYSPLAKRAYREFLEGSGAVDDAMGDATTSRDYVANHLQFLGFMNVRYIISRVNLGGIPGLELSFPAKEEEDKVYLNKHFMPRAFWVEPLAFDDDGDRLSVYRKDLKADERGIQWLRYSSQKIELETETTQDRLLFMSESYDPGWRATIDGKPAKIHRVDGVFRGIPVLKGKHRVQLVYEPFSFKAGRQLSFAALVFCAALFSKDFIIKKRRRS